MHCVDCCAPGAMVDFPEGHLVQSSEETPPRMPLKVPKAQGVATLAPAPENVPAGAG